MFNISRKFLFAAVAALTLSACGGGSVGGDGDGGDGGGGGGTPGNTITGVNLTLGTAVATPGQSVLVRASVAGTGTLSGRTVTFSTTAGTITPNTASTGEDGLAERTLIAPTQTGAVTVTATVAGFSSSQTLEVVPGPVFKVEVESLPERVALGGVSRIQALVSDQFDNPIENARVRFTVPTNNTGGRFNSGSVADTDVNGFVRVDYTAGTTPGTDSITATATGGRFGTASVNAAAVNAAPALVQLSLGRVSLQAGGSSTPATALVTDDDGAPIQGVSVGFSATGGTLRDAEGNSASSQVTNAAGRATLQYVPPPTGGNFIVRAEIGALSDEQAVVVADRPQTVRTIDLQVSSADLSSSAQSAATGVQITATVLDAENKIIPGQAVSFQSTSGVLAPVGTNYTTDLSGTVRASLTVGTNPRNRPITVTASAGSVVSTVTVNVVGTRFSAIEGPSALRAGATESNVYTVRLQDSDSNGIAGQQVRFLAFENNSSTSTVLGTVTTATNPRGQASIAVSPRAGLNKLRLVAELVTLPASTSPPRPAEVPLRTGEFEITVNNRTLSFLETGAGSSSLNSIDINTNKTVVVSLTDAVDGNVSGQLIRLNVTRGTVVSAGGVAGENETNTVAGRATFVVRGSNTGPVTLTADSPDDGLTVSRQTNYVSKTPATVELQASPATIGTNSNSEIRATVLDADGNRVVGQTVNFTIVTDPTNGTLSSTSAVTNDVGIASVTYRSSSVASARDGVSLRASTTTPAAVTSNLVTLTVGNQALRISLGTSNVINKDGDTLYKLPYAASVKDAAGNPVPEAEFSLNSRPLFYRKGQKIYNGTSWVVEPGAHTCRSEDVNDNGDLETGEDINGNGRLDPTDGVNVPRTLDLRDSDATVEFDVTYPRDRSGWIVLELTAIARVSGSEAIERAIFTLPAAADDVNDEDTSPPGQISPFGVVKDCTVFDTGAFAKFTSTGQTADSGEIVTVTVNLEGTANKDSTIRVIAETIPAGITIGDRIKTITIPAGELSGSTSFTVTNSNSATTTIRLDLDRPVNAEIGSPASHVITILPPP